MSYARRHSRNVCPGNRVRYKLNALAQAILTVTKEDGGDPKRTIDACLIVVG